MICDKCEKNETDFYCHACDEPVCEECCVVPTYMNQIDYPLCTICEDSNENEKYEEACRSEAKAEKVRKKKDKQNALKRAIYWKPENIEKRKLVKQEKKRKHAEQFRKTFAETMKIVNSMIYQN